MKKLFNENTNIVYKVFQEKIKDKMINQSMKDDLIQIGMLALWKCCMNYDPDRGTQFSTYAFNAVYKNMMCALARENKRTALLISLSKPIENNDECSIQYEDVVASSVNIASQVEIDSLVNQITEQLGNNATKIIEMVREGYSQTDIAKELNLTRARVSQTLKKFRKNLKNTLFLDDEEYNNGGQNK